MMDAFFGQAKKMVMETVGLQESVAPDAEFEKWHEHVKRLEGMAVVLRRQFNAYAASMTEMARASASLTAEVASFYDRSETRKKSVRRFVDANTEINAGVTQVYKERFGWEVLALFDKWMDELAAIKQRIRALDELRRNAIAHEEKVKDLQARVSKNPALQNDLKTAETQHAGLAANLEQGRAKMRELVKLQIDNRFGQFDAIFVRLMESQLDYFRVGSGLVDGFEPNIANYRKLYPRTEHRDDTASASSPASIGSAHDDDDESESSYGSHGSSSGASLAASTPSQQQQQQHQQHQQHQQQYETDDAADAPGGPSSNRSSAQRPKSRAAFTNDEDILDFGGLSVSKPSAAAKPASKASSAATSPHARPPMSSNEEDFLFSSFTAAPASASASGGSGTNSGRASNAASPNVQQPQPPRAGSKADDFDFLNLSSSAPAKPATKAAAASAVSDDFGFTDFTSAPSKPTKSAVSQSSAAASAAAPEHQRRSSLNGFDDLFGAPAPKAAAAPVPAAAAAKPKGFESKVDKFREEERIKEADAEERHNLNDSIQSRVDSWALKGGVSKNLRTLILTLPEVLWPGCEWQPLTMNDLMDSSAVKKAYRKAMTVLHPDKVSSLSSDIKLLAERVFDYVTKAWVSFQAQEKM